MTEVVINQNDGFVSITAVGGETDLDFDFPIYEKEHLRIIRTRAGADTDLILDTDYTIDVGELEVTAGGTAVLSVAAVAADVYTLLLNTPEERATDFNQAGDFFAATLNRELDLQTQQIQGLRRDINKSARLPDSSTLSNLQLPAPVADRIIGWNAAGDNLENKTPNTGAYLSVSPFMETVLDDTTAAAARTTLAAAASGANTDITSLAGTVAVGNAAAGKIGELLTASLGSGSATSLVNNTAKTIISLNLTAGDWDVTGSVAAGLAASTTSDFVEGGISLTDNTLPTTIDESYMNMSCTWGTGTSPAFSLPLGVKRVNVSTTTTIYLVMRLNFAVSTAAGYGLIRARRVR